MVHTRDVHGHKVTGEDEAVPGMDYLDHDLDYAEAEVFFKHARGAGSAKFEDDHERQFTLKYNGDGTYQIVGRQASKGFFGGWF